jgi:hypothetical protein
MSSDPAPFASPRRQFLKDVSVAAVGAALPLSASAADPNATPNAEKPTTKAGEIPRRKLGNTGELVSILGVGGHTLALAPTEDESIRIAITTQIVGMRSLQNLRDNLETARNFTPMPKDEMEKLVAQVSTLNVENYVQYQHPQYRDGRGILA